MKKHPKELFILASAELCERFAFWGVGNLLVLYLIQYYQFPGDRATHTYGMFTGISAFLPLLGGYLADKWNYRHPLIVGTLANALGCFLIAVGSHFLLLIALTLIAFGFGIFTPTILTLLGLTYKNHPTLREAGFSIYYASVNIGVFLALIFLGVIAKYISWEIAFITAGIVQLIGMIPIIIYLKTHHYKYIDMHPTRYSAPSTNNKKPSKEVKERVIVILVLTLFSILFWMPYSQAFSSMTIFTLKYTNKMIGNFSVPVAWILSSETLFLIILAPILAKIYSFLQKKKLDPSAPIKTALSLLLMGICFLIMLFASKEIPIGAKSGNISMVFPIVAYFFMALAEMLLAPIGLAFVTKYSPKRYTAFLVGVWFVCIGVAFNLGGFFAGLIVHLQKLYDFFLIFVVAAFVPAIILFFLSKKLNKMTHLHKPIDTGIEPQQIP